MRQLRRDEYELVVPLFSKVEYYSPVAFTVIEGKQPGTIFVNDGDSFTQAVVFGGGNYHYLAGSPDNAAFNDALRLLMGQGNRTPSVLCIHPQEWTTCIDDLFGNNARKIRIKTFRIRSDLFESNRDWQSRIPEFCRVVRIDETLYGQIVDTCSGLLGRLWPVTEDFISEGLGYCLLHGDQIASICWSAFVGMGACDISVATHPEFRRRGYGSLTAEAFVDGWLKKGLSPQWHTLPDNTASIAIAKKMGFEEIGEFTGYEIKSEISRDATPSLR